jgi:hypothetical protein
MGLIAEIQKDALDQSIPISAQLRKVRLAAAKLNLPTIETWVENELKGYRGESSVPSYRTVRGTAKSWNPYHGWIPIAGDEQTMNMVCSADLVESIASIEALVASNFKGKSYHIPFSPGKLEALSHMVGQQVARAGLDIAVGAPAHILDSVRNLILEWSINLEKAGITGEGLSFSVEEKQIARSEASSVHVGSIGTFTGNLGIGNISADITSAPVNAEQVRNLVSQIKSHRSTLTAEGVDSDALDAALKAIDLHTKAEKPALLRNALGQLQKILSKAAGGMVAHGALALLHQILGTGVPV